jgi:hypothetical protein
VEPPHVEVLTRRWVAAELGRRRPRVVNTVGVEVGLLAVAADGGT